jgi:hypothetical protein
MVMRPGDLEIALHDSQTDPFSAFGLQFSAHLGAHEASGAGVHLAINVTGEPPLLRR